MHFSCFLPMTFRINTDTWFIFCLAFLGILGILIFLYIFIPYRTRRQSNKRRTIRFQKKTENIERLEQKYKDDKIMTLEVKNQKLKVTLKDDLTKIMNTNEVANFEVFFSNFEKLYPNFKTSIYKLAPNLTSNELKLCAFLRLNLSSKQISNLVNTTPESVNKARYRLRKKLNLQANDDLLTFIINM
ncbi:helix-turn-helix transcriptional regulator [Polaribacter sp. Asnod1-A03]|uniref:helix-turn-helix transcriptional regulator n=1 Tax=Polaribacter sp. Asnod1-A03 TaxID=3160581 RepID=UPI00386C6C8F